MSAPVVGSFCRLFNELHAGNLERLADVYAPEIEFEDPLHRVEGLEALTAYFARLYDGVASIAFDFHSVLEDGDEAMLAWTMHMTHRRLKPGEPVALPGASHLRHADGRVVRHRDYFDAGALVYERLPVLGTLVRAVRARV